MRAYARTAECGICVDMGRMAHDTWGVWRVWRIGWCVPILHSPSVLRFTGSNRFALLSVAAGVAHR
eukprot:scaffold7944_cov131-Isochrysis_galbana.AAC.7